MLPKCDYRFCYGCFILSPLRTTPIVSIIGSSGTAVFTFEALIKSTEQWDPVQICSQSVKISRASSSLQGQLENIPKNPPM